MNPKKSIGRYFLNSIILLSFSMLFLNTAITTFNTYNKYKEQCKSITESYIEKQEAIVKYQVEYAVLDIETRCSNSETSQDKIKKTLLDWISQVRFPNQGRNPGFFFIRSFNGKSVMSVSTPHLVGTDISKKKDPNGIVTHDLFIKTLENGNGEGFADYSWFNPDTNQVEKKRSFIKVIPGWDSYIGSGFWFNDIQSVIDAKKTELYLALQKQLLIMIILMIILTFSSFLISQFFKKKLIKNFNHFIHFFQKATNTAALIDMDKLEYSEFNEIAVYANEMSIKQTHAENQIKQSLNEKEILLRELYHRTKNNMQVIISLLNMKASQMNDKTLELVFKGIQNKIHSMALVHEKLYQSENLSNLELDKYITDLCSYLKESYSADGQQCNFIFDMEKIVILIDFALPIGLILEELISNTFKHAYSGAQYGEIIITLKKQNNETILLQVKDNGIGFPNNFNYLESDTLGIQTIVTLAESQLNGTIEFDGSHGVICKIVFDDRGYSPRV